MERLPSVHSQSEVSQQDTDSDQTVSVQETQLGHDITINRVLSDTITCTVELPLKLKAGPVTQSLEHTEHASDDRKIGRSNHAGAL